MLAVILAGGSGTRFWPLSREQNPKQLLKITGAKTLIQGTLERLLPLIPADKCYVVTNEQHAFQTCRQLSEYGFSPANLIAEPAIRNTAPAIALAARFFEDQPDEIMAVFPADHVIRTQQSFQDAITLAESIASQGRLTTIGIKPGRPETGYGYIQQGAALNKDNSAFKIEKFIEKPDIQKAREFFKKERYLWNCGIFLWKVSVALEELRQFAPEIYKATADLKSCLQENKGKYPYKILNQKGREIYDGLPSISIDYAVMEKSQNAAVIPTSMEWSDVGSWSALEDIGEKDERKNVFSKNVISIDCSGSIVQGEDRLIAAIGLNDLIVVDSKDALLVCRKDRAQDVKKVVEEINKDNREETKIHTTVQKPWGSYTVLEKGERHLLKRIEVFPGEKLSLQSHQHRGEHWVVVSGRAEIQTGDKTITLEENESTFIPKGTKHRLGNPGDTTLTLIETQLGDRLAEDDIVRYEDKYGRT
ncbi:MAG: mannose-1-phosphate guanylyltransferase/mannose-6-phosphate isomerase [Nitrospinae bacterium]|nr:mannose-1-phosphate guanylyltransferase/mannose-6-phosphate isomerase [Nitrospinota bacterium]